VTIIGELSWHCLKPLNESLCFCKANGVDVASDAKAKKMVNKIIIRFIFYNFNISEKNKFCFCLNLKIKKKVLRKIRETTIADFILKNVFEPNISDQATKKFIVKFFIVFHYLISFFLKRQKKNFFRPGQIMDFKKKKVHNCI